MTNSELIGRRLGAFVIEEPLGKGGMGAVYRGRDTALDRLVAIKTLAPHLQEDAEYVERFVREARVAAKLNHPNVVQIYGAGSEDGVAYMALELVPGGSLLELFRDNQPFPLAVACRLVRDSARGLAAAHALDIVHRDLKPENILVTPDGKPKLADFGLAYSKAGQRITTSGMFLGTPQYSSPEQCNAETLTYATDLYSLGVVLYELVSGKPPYEAPTPLSLFKKILTDPIPTLEPERADIPDRLRATVLRLLAKSPAERHGSALELVEDLDAVIAGLPDAVPETFRWPSERISVRDRDQFAKAVTIADRGSNATASVFIAEDPESQMTPIPMPGVEDDTATLALPPSARKTGGHTPLPDATAGAPRKPGRSTPLVLAGAVLALLCVLAVSLLTTRRGPVRVSVAQWNRGQADEDFDWLADAIPEFVSAELDGHTDQVILVDPGDPADAVLSGTFRALGEQVSITTVVTADGRELKAISVFSKAQVLDALAKHGREVLAELAKVEVRPSSPTAGASEPQALASADQVGSPQASRRAAPAPAAPHKGIPQESVVLEEKEPEVSQGGPGAQEAKANALPARQGRDRARETTRRTRRRGRVGELRGKFKTGDPSPKDRDEAAGAKPERAAPSSDGLLLDDSEEDEVPGDRLGAAQNSAGAGPAEGDQEAGRAEPEAESQGGAHAKLETAAASPESPRPQAPATEPLDDDSALVQQLRDAQQNPPVFWKLGRLLSNAGRSKTPAAHAEAEKLMSSVPNGVARARLRGMYKRAQEGR